MPYNDPIHPGDRQEVERAEGCLALAAAAALGIFLVGLYIMANYYNTHQSTPMPVQVIDRLPLQEGSR